MLCLGVLRHLSDPLAATRRLHALCDGVAVIETEAIALGSHPDACVWKFTAMREDRASGCVPTRAGLDGICRAAGFGRIEHHGEPVPDAAPATSVPYRAVVHAWR